jgi:hypothetical protein
VRNDVIKFSLLSRSILAWFHGARPISASVVTNTEAFQTNPPLQLGCEKRWLCQVRQALRAIETISNTSPAEPIRSLLETAVRAEALADEIIIRMERDCSDDARVVMLVRDLSEVTAAIESRIRELRYELALSDLLTQSAAARSLAHSVEALVTGGHAAAPELMQRVVLH